MSVSNSLIEARNRLFMLHVTEKLGILPISKTSHDMRDELNKLSDDERRQFSRKFRKLWKQARKWKIKTFMRRHQINKHMYNQPVKYLDRALGVGEKNPSKNHKIARKALVYEYIQANYITAMINRQ